MQLTQAHIVQQQPQQAQQMSAPSGFYHAGPVTFTTFQPNLFSQQQPPQSSQGNMVMVPIGATPANVASMPQTGMFFQSFAPSTPTTTSSNGMAIVGSTSSTPQHGAPMMAAAVASPVSMRMQQLAVASSPSSSSVSPVNGDSSMKRKSDNSPPNGSYEDAAAARGAPRPKMLHDGDVNQQVVPSMARMTTNPTGGPVLMAPALRYAAPTLMPMGMMQPTTQQPQVVVTQQQTPQQASQQAVVATPASPVATLANTQAMPVSQLSMGMPIQMPLQMPVMITTAAPRARIRSG